MTDTLLFLLLPLAVAFVATGVLYRVTDGAGWPAWLAFVGQIGVAAGAFLGGMLVALRLWPQETSDGGKANSPEAVEPTTTADELDAEIDQAEADETDPTVDEIVEDLNEELLK